MKVNLGLAILLLAPFLQAQTVTLNDDQVIVSAPKRVGIALNGLNYYDSGQILKNLFVRNPGFEPASYRQIWTTNTAGTTTTFQGNNIYDMPPVNFWAGASFSIVSGPEMGCAGTIASNTTGDNTSQAPVYTFSSPCASATQPGDIMVLTQTETTTSSANWTGPGGNGIWSSTSGGGQIGSDNTNLCPSCGNQALLLDGTQGAATMSQYFDTLGGINFTLLNGTYQLSFMARARSGSPSLQVAGNRLAANGLSCGAFTAYPTASWTQYSYTCTGSENATTGVGPVQFSWTALGGQVSLDNISLVPTTGQDSTNTTIFSDQAVHALQSWFSNAAGGPRGNLRLWDASGQLGENLDNWIQPTFTRGPVNAGMGATTFYQDAKDQDIGLHEYLVLCQLLNVDPYIVIPDTFSFQEYSELVDYLAGTSSTTFGARRVALGQQTPWSQVFVQIHLELGNENWNTGTFSGENIGWRSGAANLYSDYAQYAKSVFSTMRRNPGYPSGVIELVANMQEANDDGGQALYTTSGADALEIASYWASSISDTSSLAALWTPSLAEPYVDYVDPAASTHFEPDYTDAATWGAKLNIYEENVGTVNGTLDQATANAFIAGAGQGLIAANRELMNMQHGIEDQNFFGLTQYEFPANGLLLPMWGAVSDFNNPNDLRPQFLATEIVNASVIGPMFSCPASGLPTVDFAANNNSVHAWGGVPQMYIYCFESGSERSVVVINTDPFATHPLQFTGTNIPQGSLTQRQIALPVSAVIPSMSTVALGDPVATTSVPTSFPAASITSLVWDIELVPSLPGRSRWYWKH